MSVRILTKSLVALLTDLVLTADQAADAGALGSVMLYTARGGHGAEPGQNDLLCGISTNRATVGYTSEPCSGQLVRPTLWPVRDIKSVLQVFKPLGMKDENHGVTIGYEGDMMTVREDPAQPELPLEDGQEVKGRELRFAQARFEDYVGPSVFRLLDLQDPPMGKTRRKDKVEWRALPRTDILGDRLAAFAKIGARRGCAVRLFRDHQERRVLVQIGEHYRGALRPNDYDPDGDERTPTAEVHTPDLLLLAEMTNVKTNGDPMLDLKTASGLLFSEQKDEPAEPDGPAPGGPVTPGEGDRELPLDEEDAGADDAGDAEGGPDGDEPAK